MISTEIKKKVAEAVKTSLARYASAAKMAVALGTSSAQLSRVLKGETEGVLSEAIWLTIARKLNVELGERTEWKVARTPTYIKIYTQLKKCQERGVSGMMCDLADTGKTFAARTYARENRNVAYIDCSQVKSKQQLIRAIAQEFGVGNTGLYRDVYADLVFYLRTLPNPLIILDEAGDLEYKAFLELKALWNATEYYVGWYMMGADGLKAKIEQNKAYRRVGYEEIYTRFGSWYQRATPAGAEALEDYKRQQIAMIAEVNCPGADIQKLYAKTGGSLRRLRIEIQKRIEN